MLLKKYPPLVFLLLTLCTNAQKFTLDADIRPRFEYRHGFGSLFPDEAKPAAFVTQRSRLNFNYQSEKLQSFISIQDISTWGDTRQILPQDGNDSFMLFQAWAQLQLNGTWAVKLGRQVIAYDDQRIFGGLDWAMQGRFHDALLLKYQSPDFYMDIGAAYNQENQAQTGNSYSIQGFFSYKTMRYAYLRKSWEKTKVSLLLLNNGFQKISEENQEVIDGLYNRQTVGSYFNSPIGPLFVSASAYYQFGYASTQQKLSAYQYSILATYKPQKTLFGLGFEVLSGTDVNVEGKNNSFFPLYGTNHKFNGFMDYFYVGNHANSIGLRDFYGKITFPAGIKNSFLLKAHHFSSAASLGNNIDNYLGIEADVVFTHQFSKDVKLNLGYSQMFASESMAILKTATHKSSNNWAWAQLTINPQIFQFNFDQ